MPISPVDRLALRQLRPAFHSSRMVTLFLKISMLAVTRPRAIEAIERDVAARLEGRVIDVAEPVTIGRPRPARAALAHHELAARVG